MREKEKESFMEWSPRHSDALTIRDGVAKKVEMDETNVKSTW